VSYAQEVADTVQVSESDTLFKDIKFYRPAEPGIVGSLDIPESSGLYYIKLSSDRLIITRDSLNNFLIQRQLFELDISAPLSVNFEEFADLKKQQKVRDNWKRFIEQSKREQQQGTGVLDFKIKIPTGKSSAFTTIFGKPEVNLRVNGTANMNVGASVQNLDDPSVPPDQQSRVDPTFNQNLQLNIQGTIGDKLTISTDWDTERAFDFQNRLNIVYEGYEDEIIKRIELGNVSMETGNSLIRGGSSLFGIKSIAELGRLRLTSVLSQQQGEEQTQTITGGAEEQQISIEPAQYENNRHFFLDFYNRQQFEENMSNPQQLGLAFEISELDVWVRRNTSSPNPNAIRAAAIADLGVVELTDGTFDFPDNEDDRFPEVLLEQFRDSVTITAQDLGLPGDESQNLESGSNFEPLIEGQDYTVNRALGYITLNQALGPNEVLAVAFSYLDPQTQEIIEVGDIGNPLGNELFYLKMLRPSNVDEEHRVWPLTLRNIYSLGVRNLNREGFELDIQFTEGNLAQNALPGRSIPLLQELGLDRLDTQGAQVPDNQIDFASATLDPVNGRVIFPFLEPFGNRIDQLLQEAGATPEERERLAFSALYNERQSIAPTVGSQNNFYELTGSSKGGVSGNFALGISLVEGSVKVFSNGTELIEGTDYEVDYSFGSITILNDRYLAAGQEIRIEYENNQLSIIGQKNFTGLRAEYEVNPDIVIGSTFFRLKEQPLSDKIRIGSEPINNSVIGLDAKARWDTPWLTRLIDQVPLLQTKESSNFSISGEFAQLRPGVAQTNAVSDAISRGELFEDEENGLVFIDDFEGTEINISFLSPTRWDLAAAPVAIPGLDAAVFDAGALPDLTLEARTQRADYRSQFSWYAIPRNIFENTPRTPESAIIRVTDVFPGRETNNPQEEILTPLDVYYNPNERGPYNYNKSLRQLLEEQPEATWGGMTATLPSGQEDLTQNNIEFLEFWVQPVLPNGREPTATDLEDYDGKIFIDLGLITEDVVPNFRLNTEDGLATDLNDLRRDLPETRSYLPTNPPPPEGQFSNQNRELEDVGYDGLPDANGFDNGLETLDEQSIFTEFVDSMRAAYGEGSPQFNEIQADPSNDNYIYFGESQVNNLPVNERFFRMMGYYEGNTPVAGGERRAATNRPDTEGLRTPSVINQTDSYFQYEIELNPADIDNLEPGSPGTFIVDEVRGERQQDRWFQVRIPLNEFERKFGSINDFQNINYIRVWASGYKKPFTMRFATFEFVGSQWRKVENLPESDGSVAEIQISTVNIEENGNRQPFPYRQPEGSIREVNRGTQLQSLQNEQSIVMQVESLGPGEIQMVKRVYPGGLNLLNYSNMRMFVHGEGFDERGDAELVMRFGTDLLNNYYEYRQPVTPTDPDFNFGPFDPDDGGRLEIEAEQIWLYEENSMNIVLRAFNQLKQLRDQQGIDPTAVFEREDLLEEGVPGAVIAIKGNPSLDRVAEIGMGIKNSFDPAAPGNGVPELNAEFWLNELRLSGFDNISGWAANTKATLKMADFATVNANLSRQTNGFGSLDSRLGQRRQSEVLGYDINSTINLHKLIPDRFGWNFPVGLTARSSTSTPRFLPNQGDVRLEDFKEAVNANEELQDSEKEQIIDSRIREVQTFSESYSINMSNISKENSKGKLARYTLDNTTLRFVYNTSNSRSPEIKSQNRWNYDGSIRYNLTFRNVKLFRPFNFTSGLPLFKTLAGLQIGYMPSSITASSSLRRNYDEQRRRQQEGQEPQPLQQTHTFTNTNTFGFNYNLTPSISTSFQTNSNFDLSTAGIENANRSGIDSASFRVIPTGEVLRGVLFDSLNARRSSYRENYTASWRPRLNQVDAVNWLSYTASYGGGFQWTNSPRGSDLGATVSNSFNLDNNVKFDVENILQRLPFYQNAVEKDEAESRRRGNSENSDQDLFRDAAFVGRKFLLAVFSMRTIDASYQKTKTASQAGFSGSSRLFQAFGGSGDDFSPPLSYRLGIEEDIGREQLIDNVNGTTILQLPANNTFSDNLTFGTRINPFPNFTIDLDWSTRWDERRTEAINLDPQNQIQSVLSKSGNISSSVWAFGGGYRDFFERQLETAFEDIDLNSDDPSLISDDTGNGDGRSVLGKNTLQEDFRKAYLGENTGAVGDLGYTPFPKPGWTVTWSGIEKFLPVFGQYLSRATLTHSYKGEYRLGWALNNSTGPQNPQGLGGFTLINFRDEIEPNSINITKTFAPLVQLTMTWNSSLRTNLAFEQSEITSLSLSSTTVTENTSKGVRATLSYTLRNIRLPIFKQVKNNIDITLNGGIAEDTEEKFLLNSDIEGALTGGPDDIIFDTSQPAINPRPPTGQRRVTGSANIGYRFSSTITANFEYSYSQTIPKSSRTFARTTHDIRFNIRIAIRSN